MSNTSYTSNTSNMILLDWLDRLDGLDRSCHVQHVIHVQHVQHDPVGQVGQVGRVRPILSCPTRHTRLTRPTWSYWTGWTGWTDRRICQSLAKSVGRCLVAVGNLPHYPRTRRILMKYRIVIMIALYVAQWSVAGSPTRAWTVIPVRDDPLVRRIGHRRSESV